MSVDLATIERVILAEPPSISVTFPPDLFEPPALIDDGFGDQLAATAGAPELMEEAVFLEQWSGLHDVAGFTLQMRIGAPVELGDQARTDAGQAAGRALYGLIRRSPALSRILLTPDSDIWGGLMLVGMHGIACARIISAASNHSSIESANE